jgi:hypothetical protein
LRVSNEQAWKALEHIKPGEVQRVFGVIVRRADGWGFEVGGAPARLLLPAIDALMAAANFRALDEPVAAHGPRRPPEGRAVPYGLPPGLPSPRSVAGEVAP